MSKAQWSILEVNELLAKWRYDKPLDFEGSPMRLLIESLVSQIATNQSKLSSLEEQAQALVSALRKSELQFGYFENNPDNIRDKMDWIISRSRFMKEQARQALEAYEALKRKAGCHDTDAYQYGEKPKNE